jgi:hypothetical protein
MSRRRHFYRCTNTARSLASLGTLLAALGLALAAPAARADCAQLINQSVQNVAGMKTPIGIFSADGKFLREEPRSAIDRDAKVLECNAALNLVKIKVSGVPVWVDRLDLSLRVAAAAPCVIDPNRKRDDHTEPVSAGSGDHCTPTPKTPAPETRPPAGRTR